MTLSVCDFNGVQMVITQPTSVLTADGAIVITAFSGAGAYQYSIDGGQNFFASGTFLGLPVGDYNVIVMDDLGICEYDYDIPLFASGINGVEAPTTEAEQRVQLYPNPTQGDITVDAASFGDLNGPIQVEVMDHLGRRLASRSLAPGRTSTVISLEQYPAGPYIVKCFNDTWVQNFKVIKR